MSWHKASKFDLLTIESLPLRPSDQDCKSCFSPSSEKRKARSTIKVTALTLPQSPSFGKVPVQTRCFYAHAHIPVPRLPQRETDQKRNSSYFNYLLCISDILRFLHCQGKMACFKFLSYHLIWPIQWQNATCCWQYPGDEQIWPHISLQHSHIYLGCRREELSPVPVITINCISRSVKELG
jgi:hypothetical protein